MEPKDILEKTLKGELSGDALTEEVGKLTVEQQAELSRLSKESAAKSLNEASGLRKERDRINEQKTEAEKAAEKAAADAETARLAAEAAGGQAGQSPANDATMSQFRKEQVDKAVNRLKSEFNLTDEQVTEVVAHFGKIDSGKVDADNIFVELKGSYAFLNSDTVLQAAADKQAREKAAADEEAAAAGGAQGEPSGSQPPKYSDDTKKLAKDANISLEAAQKVATEGTKRVFE